MEDSKSSENINQIKSDARKAIWIFTVLNLSVIFLAFIQAFDLVFAILFIQIVLFLVWLLPVALYQIIKKNHSTKVAIYKALGSYRSIMEQVSW
ncbi:hypothetical protein [Pseudoalteromonas sp. SR43-3]|uniref:hypothetical protein n=1 Tax=Pseudoalteromonas sp. SR43-3 TaxID=2760943 RepID=UPI0016018797|nr:hypothetical protein [Pseudoalteromonas sp. SR43-3]MBB1276508.1 hypothetical protein [Pseudoalteromonas sp. SR43-3]